MDANHIRQHVAKYYTDKRWSVHFELGVVKGGSLRVDILAFNMKSQLVIIEVKSSVQDFKTDRKFHRYANYCDKLYLAMADDVYHKVKHLIPKGVGVFIVSEAGARVEVKARSNPIDADTRLNVITRAAYRTGTIRKTKNKDARPKFVVRKVQELLASPSLTKSLFAAIKPYV